MAVAKPTCDVGRRIDRQSTTTCRMALATITGTALARLGAFAFLPALAVGAAPTSWVYTYKHKYCSRVYASTFNAYLQ
jgi:hypothetical protein